MNKNKMLEDRCIGAMFGLAVGDALGMPVEFHQQPFQVTEMMPSGPDSFHKGLAAGQWTDDTAMALCLASSLIACGFNPNDQMDRYILWGSRGYMSSTGRTFGMGSTTRLALRRYKGPGTYPFCGSTSPQRAGNGSLMRLAPVPIYYSYDIDAAVHYSREQSKVTHGAQVCLDACAYYGGLIAAAINNASKDELLSPHFAPPNGWAKQFGPEIQPIIQGDYIGLPRVPADGHVLTTLRAALWAFSRTNNFKDGALAAVNLGGDADTTGAVYGQLAGAYYGAEAIPAEWRHLVNKQTCPPMRGMLDAKANSLAIWATYALARTAKGLPLTAGPVDEVTL